VEVFMQSLNSVSMALLLSLLAVTAMWGAALHGVVPLSLSRPPSIPMDLASRDLRTSLGGAETGPASPRL
jgi:hypothetical protein